MTELFRARREAPLAYVRELRRADLSTLVQIEEVCHPPEVRDGLDFFDGLLGDEWDGWPVPHGRTLPARRPIRLGLAVGTRLVGYLLARQCEADGRPFTHVDDLAILPEQRRHLMRLIRDFVDQHRRWNDGAPVIAHGYAAENSVWERHRRVFERLGGVLAAPEVVGESIGGRPLQRVRWEPRVEDATRNEPTPGAGTAAARTAAALEPVGTIRSQAVEYEIELARTVAQWESLAPGWDGLLSRVHGATGFQTFPLLRLWWDHFGLSGTPFIVVVRRAGELVGIAPLAVCPALIGGRAVRRLGFIGSRWEIDRPHFLFADEPEACAQALARAVIDRRDAWDVLHLYEQPADSSALSALTRSLHAAGYLVGRLPDSVCPYLRTQGSWETFLHARSRNLRKNLRRAGRELERHGPVEYRVIDRPSAIDAAFTRYLALEGRSWKADTEVGLRVDAVHQAFYRDLVRVLGHERRVQFRFIDVAGEAVAGTFGMQHGRHFYSLKIAHDQRFAPASPGTLLESFEIRDCFRGEIVEYDFLGGFLANKNRWTDDARRTVQVFAVPRHGRWIVFYLSRFVLRPRIRKFLQRAGWLDPMLTWRDRLAARVRGEAAG